jgi:hypothetical protein
MFRYRLPILLFLLWTGTVKAQTPDSPIFNKSQLIDSINWKTYQTVKTKQPPQVILKLNAGFGARVAKTSVNEEIQPYFSKLKFGFAWDASSDYIFSNNFGARMAFYQFSASHSDQKQSLTIKDKITFIGPSFVIRMPFEKRPWESDVNVGVGYIENRGKLTSADGYTNYYGATVGAQIGIGIECKLISQLGIGINMQVTFGEITKFRYDSNGEKWTTTYEAEQGEDLSQISMGIGIRYYFK